MEQEAEIPEQVKVSANQMSVTAYGKRYSATPKDMTKGCAKQCSFHNVKDYQPKLNAHVLYCILCAVFLLTSCDRVQNTAKKTINKGGETVGKAATEFFEGVGEGFDQTLQCEVSLSESLVEAGLKTGKFIIKNADEGKNNRFVVYFIFDKDFDSPVTAKVFDKKGLELGRSKTNVVGNADGAAYFDFVFDKRSYIETKSKIVLETSK